MISIVPAVWEKIHKPEENADRRGQSSFERLWLFMGRLCSRGNVPHSVQDKRLEQSFLQIYYQYKRQDIGPDSVFIHSIPAETTSGNIVWELFPKIGKQLKDWWWGWQHPWEKGKMSTVLPHLLYISEKLVWFLLFWVKINSLLLLILFSLGHLSLYVTPAKQTSTRSYSCDFEVDMCETLTQSQEGCANHMRCCTYVTQTDDHGQENAINHASTFVPALLMCLHQKTIDIHTCVNKSWHVSFVFFQILL